MHNNCRGATIQMADLGPLNRCRVALYCQLQMSGNDAGFLVIPGNVASELLDLSSQIFEHSGQINWSTDTLGIISFTQQSLNAINWKLLAFVLGFPPVLPLPLIFGICKVVQRITVVIADCLSYSHTLFFNFNFICIALLTKEFCHKAALQRTGPQ